MSTDVGESDSGLPAARLRRPTNTLPALRHAFFLKIRHPLSCRALQNLAADSMCGYTDHDAVRLHDVTRGPTDLWMYM